MTFLLMARPAVLRCVLVLTLWIAAGCARHEGDTAPAADGARRYPLTGVVLAVDVPSRTLRVQHDDIPGLMPAMTMEFTVREGDLAIAREGRRIRATLVQRDTEFSLENLWPDDADTTRALGAGAAALKQDTVIRGTKAYREVGEAAPEFALLDQDGRVVRIERLRGKRVVLNFIYTRCPIATMCPAATARMVALQRAARRADVANLELVSITLDPAYDTPGVLRDYATANGIDTANFSLLTGPEGAIRDLLAQMGVLVEFDGALLKHSLTTVLIDETGRIVWREDGSLWQPETFLAKLGASDSS
ncbi:MAG TPA: SCO family protein [Opitutaceae bacterium]|nr:SCO family protein [Opitutaceae bacterium]